MPSTTAQKLKIKEGFSLLTINAPADFTKELGGLPNDVNISNRKKIYDQIHWFVKDKAQLDEEVEQVVGLLKNGVILWTYFPKGSSKIQTDLTRDRGWDKLHKRKGLQWLTLISFNDTWSAFSMRLQTPADLRKQVSPKERPIFQFIDAGKKLVFLPEDFEKELNGAPKEKAFFESLSFTNKKEYVEWIVTAKREDTRASRLKQSIEQLRKGWKNPANR